MAISTLDAALLGLVQGLTEFLPVSSSGHLVLFGHALGLTDAADNVFFDTLLHGATLLAVLCYFARDVGRAAVAFVRAAIALPRVGGQAFTRPADAPADGASYDAADAQLALFVLIATVPTGLIGVLFKDPLESLFGSPRLVAGALFGTAAILVSTRWAWSRAGRQRPLGWLNALIVGTAQGVAIVPGISRSGSTIAAGLWCGIAPAQAARASFLMSVPAILGAMALQLRHLGEVSVSGSAAGL
ncbi:MAG: undecaprenyl-diphosphate phosphatase, partial [Deltaproteobacteria bacterium]|nr:undecaprenyl-diphosphate phosphatase [Deltaproteobacteria bacterium]